jgi:transcriptional/translational regulatory protein YebC/TACO1
MSRLGGNLGTPNSVAWMFEKKGAGVHRRHEDRRGCSDGSSPRCGRRGRAA